MKKSVRARKFSRKGPEDAIPDSNQSPVGREIDPPCRIDRGHFGPHFRPCAGAFARRMRSRWRASSPDASLSGVEVTDTSVGWFSSRYRGVSPCGAFTPSRAAKFVPCPWDSGTREVHGRRRAVSSGGCQDQVPSVRVAAYRGKKRAGGGGGGEGGGRVASLSARLYLSPFAPGGFFGPPLSSFLLEEGGGWGWGAGGRAGGGCDRVATLGPRSTTRATKLENYFGASDKLAFIGKRFSPSRPSLKKHAGGRGCRRGVRRENGEGTIDDATCRRNPLRQRSAGRDGGTMIACDSFGPVLCG